MKFQVELTAQSKHEGKEVIREVEVPDCSIRNNESDLETIFFYGQNDFQPVEKRCSVSVGDVIQLRNQRFAVAPIGWRLLSGMEETNSGKEYEMWMKNKS